RVRARIAHASSMTISRSANARVAAKRCARPGRWISAGPFCSDQAELAGAAAESIDLGGEAFGVMAEVMPQILALAGMHVDGLHLGGDVLGGGGHFFYSHHDLIHFAVEALHGLADGVDGIGHVAGMAFAICRETEAVAHQLMHVPGLLLELADDGADVGGGGDGFLCQRTYLVGN